MRKRVTLQLRSAPRCRAGSSSATKRLLRLRRSGIVSSISRHNLLCRSSQSPRVRTLTRRPSRPCSENSMRTRLQACFAPKWAASAQSLTTTLSFWLILLRVAQARPRTTCSMAKRRRVSSVTTSTGRHPPCMTLTSCSQSRMTTERESGERFSACEPRSRRTNPRPNSLPSLFWSEISAKSVSSCLSRR